jgi:predicted transcriptional regulator
MIKCPRCFRDALYDASEDLLFCVRCGYFPVDERPTQVRYDTAYVPAEDVETKITKHLLAAEQPLTAREIAQQAGLKRTAVYEAIPRLAKRGIISRIGGGINTNPYRWYLSPIARESAKKKAWTIQQATKELGVSEQWIFKMVKHYKIGERVGSRRLLFERDMELLRQIKEERAALFVLGREISKLRLNPKARQTGEGITAQEYKELHSLMIEERESKKRAKKAAAM